MQEGYRITFHELHCSGARVSGSALRGMAGGTVDEAALLSGTHLDNQQAPGEDGLQLLQLLIMRRRLPLWLFRAALLLISFLHQHTNTLSLMSFHHPTHVRTMICCCPYPIPCHRHLLKKSLPCTCSGLPQVVELCIPRLTRSMLAILAMCLRFTDVCWPCHNCIYVPAVAAGRPRHQR